MGKRRITTLGREFDPFAGKYNCVSSLTPVMETLVLQVLMCHLIGDYAEQMGPCPNPWAPRHTVGNYAIIIYSKG